MLIDEIITLLSGEPGKLTDALLKTKVLLHQIGKKEAAGWVNFELNGYPESMELPEYRVLPSSLLGNASNGEWRIQERPLPTGHLKAEQRKAYTTAELRQSLSILEQFGTTGVLAREVPPEAYGILGQGLSNGFHIERAWCRTPAHDIQGVLTQVRSRLLDFMLELKETVGDADDNKTIRENLDSVDTGGMLRHAMFGTIGDNATIIFGGQNSLDIKNDVHKGDFASLAKVLLENRIPNDDIEVLRAAITQDKVSGEVELSKGQTGRWLLGLLEKAAKGSLKVGTAVVAHVATESLTKYIGG